MQVGKKNSCECVRFSIDITCIHCSVETEISFLQPHFQQTDVNMLRKWREKVFVSSIIKSRGSKKEKKPPLFCAFRNSGFEQMIFDQILFL